MKIIPSGYEIILNGATMAIGMIMEFDGFAQENYDAVSSEMNWPENWPDGLRFHVAGTANGGMRIVEIWDSREQHDSWMQNTVNPAIQKAASEAAASSPQPRFTEFAVFRQESR